MSIKTVWICDNCEAVHDADKDMFRVGIRIFSENYATRFQNTYLTESNQGMALWCQECCIKQGLMGIIKPKGPEPEAQPSLEENIKLLLSQMIEEIAQEVVDNIKQN